MPTTYNVNLANNDISEYVYSVQINTGFGSDPFRRVAYVGSCTLIVDNSDREFTPNNSNSLLYNVLKPYAWLYITATLQIGDQFYQHPLFEGYVQTITPNDDNTFRATLYAVDYMGVLQAAKIRIPLIETKYTGDAISRIVNMAFNASPAEGTITFNDLPANNNTVTVGTRTYTFKTTLTGAAYEVLIAGTVNGQAIYLARAINTAQTGVGTQYTAATTKHPTVTAAASAGVVTVTAGSPGAWGNALDLSKVGANISVSGSSLADGEDLPYDHTTYDTGTQILNRAGDIWGDTVNALTAVEQVVDSEQGLFWCGTTEVGGYTYTGVLIFKDKDYLFELPVATPVLDLSDAYAPFRLHGSSDIDDIYNRVTVTYAERSQATVGVVAQAAGSIKVPGGSGGARYNLRDAIPWDNATGDNITVILPFVDPATGRKCGARGIVTPLEAGTDYTVTDDVLGTGFDYTDSGRISTSVAVGGAGVEVTFANSAIGPLWVHDLQVRGNLLVNWQQQNITLDDLTSQQAYGKRERVIDIPFPERGGDTLARALAQYVIGRYKDPAFRLTEIDLMPDQQYGQDSVHEYTIGDLITVSSTRLDIDTDKYMIAGIALYIEGQNLKSLSWRVRALGDQTYWILGDSTYGVLGSTTRLGM